jgi:outer membrane protein OmpA-like peptidoglycan-associated protein
MGAAGPQGERGPVGNAGAQGPTTYGPTGPDGYAGPAGGQGAVGEQGSQGSTTSGVAGLAGLSGPTGAPGGIGTIGEPGAPGVVGHWVFYKEINFSSNDAALSPSGMERISEIAAYMKQNPSLQIGIDGTAVNSNDQDLNDHRIVAIQQELIKDGVSADRIGRGRLDNSKFRRDGRISIFFKTA